jgi:hypothetical protein
LKKQTTHHLVYRQEFGAIRDREFYGPQSNFAPALSGQTPLINLIQQAHSVDIKNLVGVAKAEDMALADI